MKVKTVLQRLPFSKRTWWKHYAATLRYGLYVVLHPFDGFWDLKHEKRGSMAAANTFVLLALLTQVWSRMYSNWLFVDVDLQRFNVWLECGTFLVPLVIFCIANWCLTTLFDGKGTLRDIYILTAYALVPFILLRLPMTFVSNVLLKDEQMLFTFFNSLGLLWSAALLICGQMMVHDYSLSKTLLFTVATVVGMAVIITLCLMIFSMVSEAVGYFASLYRELRFQFY